MIIRIIFGLVLVTILPGYLLSKLLVRKLNLIERVGLSFCLNILIVVALGFIFTLIGWLNHSRIITDLNIWISLTGISTILGISLLIQRFQKRHHVKKNREFDNIN